MMEISVKTKKITGLKKKNEKSENEHEQVDESRPIVNLANSLIIDWSFRPEVNKKQKVQSICSTYRSRLHCSRYLFALSFLYNSINPRKWEVEIKLKDERSEEEIN